MAIGITALGPCTPLRPPLPWLHAWAKKWTRSLSEVDPAGGNCRCHMLLSLQHFLPHASSLPFSTQVQMVHVNAE